MLPLVLTCLAWQVVSISSMPPPYNGHTPTRQSDAGVSSAVLHQAIQDVTQCHAHHSPAETPVRIAIATVCMVTRYSPTATRTPDVAGLLLHRHDPHLGQDLR